MTVIKEGLRMVFPISSHKVILPRLDGVSLPSWQVSLGLECLECPGPRVCVWMLY